MAVPPAPTITTVFDDNGATQGPVPNGGATDDKNPTFEVSLAGTQAAANDHLVIQSESGGVKIDHVLTAEEVASGVARLDLNIPFESASLTFHSWVMYAGGGNSAVSSGYRVDYRPDGGAQLSISGGGSRLEGSSGETLFTFTVSRSGDTSGATLADYFSWGDADAADFAADPRGTVYFAAGETSKTITIRVAGDATPEPDELFHVVLSNPRGGSIGAGVGSAEATIRNDDTSAPPPSPPPPAPPSGTAGQDITSPGPNSTLNGTAGNDTFHASQGYDVITGGAGADVIAFGQEPWAPITVKDFHVGEDRLDWSALFQASGYTGSDPIADGYVRFQADGANTLVLFDRDAAGTAQQYPNYVLKLEGVQAGSLTWAQLSGGSGPVSPPPPPGAIINFETTAVTDVEFTRSLNSFLYTVTRTGDTTTQVSARWTVDGTGEHPADPGSDFAYNVTSGTVVFQPGETSKVIHVDIAGDGAVEPDETFRVTLFSPYNAQIGSQSTALGTILNDDTTAAQPGQDITSPGPNSTLTGTSGNDTFHASQGYDVITGGSGADRFVFAQEPWAPIEITDFQTGVDKLDLGQIFDRLGYTGSDPFADGYLFMQSDGRGGAQILIDRDLSGPEPQYPNYIIHLQGVAPSSLTPGDWIFQ